MNTGENYCLLGVIGKTAEVILGEMLNGIKARGEKIYFHRESAFLISRNSILKYSPRIDTGNKILMLFGNFFLKDIDLDPFLNAPYKYLKKVAELDRSDIPFQFTNGAYIGVIKDSDSYIIFNDFFGLQPLYYFQRSGYVIISTKLKLLNRYIGTGLNREVLNEYLALGNVLSHRTVKREVNTLPPASMLIIKKNGEVKIENYTTYSNNTLLEDKMSNIAEEIRDSFKDSVKRIYSDKLKYCLNLTGGSDTRLVFLEWPNRHDLLTETAGAEDSSDVIKAKELVKIFGNPLLHARENLQERSYLDGFKKYYELCDNPLNVKQNFNFYHLRWKVSRSADIRLYGAGELFAGENLYLSRNPLYLLREAFFPYRYHKLEESDKLPLIKNALNVKHKSNLKNLLKKDLHTEFDLNNLLKTLMKYLGHAKYKETYTERFRAYILALFGYRSFFEILSDEFILVSPYNDRKFIEHLLKYHPQYRELRKLQLRILKKYYSNHAIPLDTTHLPLSAPYYLHKIFRVPRFVLNIGFHKKVPFIQKGNPPIERVDPYLVPHNREFRNFIKTSIFDSDIFDRKKLDTFFRPIESKKFNFFTHHKELTNIYILFRLSYAIANLKR